MAAVPKDSPNIPGHLIRSDCKFARLFFAGAIEMLLEGETAEALARLRDLVHAEITFKELARQTGLGEKNCTGC